MEGILVVEVQVMIFEIQNFYHIPFYRNEISGGNISNLILLAHKLYLIILREKSFLNHSSITKKIPRILSMFYLLQTTLKVTFELYK